MSLASIEAGLATDWSKVVAFLSQAEAGAMNFLQTVATGGPILVADIEGIASAIAGKLGIVNATIAAVGAVATSIAPGNANVAKVIADLQAGANDVAALHASLTSGDTTGDDKVVATAVATVNAVNQVSVLAAQAAAILAQATAAAPAATQAVSQPTPPQA
jgi:hypothetical protein